MYIKNKEGESVAKLYDYIAQIFVNILYIIKEIRKKII